MRKLRIGTLGFIVEKRQIEPIRVWGLALVVKIEF